MLRIREIRQQRDEEITGGWYCEERMKTELKYSQSLGCHQQIWRCCQHSFLLLNMNAQVLDHEGQGLLRKIQICSDEELVIR